MATLFPPVLDPRGPAVRNSEEYLSVTFKIPEINGTFAVDFKHLQVLLKYKENGQSAVNDKYSPDNTVLFYQLSEDEAREGSIYSLQIPYWVFAGGEFGTGLLYQIQIRFGRNQLWDSASLKKGWASDFEGYSNWYAEQLAQPDPAFSDWSNTQIVYISGDAAQSINYDMDDFVPHISYTYTPDTDDPVEICTVSYSYKTVTKMITRQLIVPVKKISSSSSYSVDFNLNVAPVTLITVNLTILTKNNAIYEQTLIIPPYGVPASTDWSVEDIIFTGEELEDGAIGKRLQYKLQSESGSYSCWVAIYRVNLYTFEAIKVYVSYHTFAPKSYLDFKDYSVEMGEEYQYLFLEKGTEEAAEGGVASPLINIYPWGYDNPGYARNCYFNSVFLDDKYHQLRIQGNVTVSSFKRTTSDQFQATIGSKYPFYSRGAETNYRSLQLGGLITINCDPTATFFSNDQANGLYWDEETLVILNKDLFNNFGHSLSRIRIDNNNRYPNKIESNSIIEYGQQEQSSHTLRGPSSIYDEYYSRNHQSKIGCEFSNEMIYVERKFRDYVMEWLSNGEPKLLRSETEGNMIVVPSAISFTPFDKSGRMVYTVSMTLTEIAKFDLDGLKDYDLIPIQITSNMIRRFPIHMNIGDIISEQDYLALIQLEPALKDEFEMVAGGWQVKSDDKYAVLQEVLQNITDYTFLRGDPQEPIYEDKSLINKEELKKFVIKEKEV